MEQAFSLRTQSRIYWLVLGTAAVTGSTKEGMLTWSQSSYWVNVTRWGLERTWYFISGPTTTAAVHDAPDPWLLQGRHHVAHRRVFLMAIRLTRDADVSR